MLAINQAIYATQRVAIFSNEVTGNRGQTKARAILESNRDSFSLFFCFEIKQVPSDGKYFRRDQMKSGSGAVPIFRRANTFPAPTRPRINTRAIVQGAREDGTALSATRVQGVC